MGIRFKGSSKDCTKARKSNIHDNPSNQIAKQSLYTKKPLNNIVGNNWALISSGIGKIKNKGGQLKRRF